MTSCPRLAVIGQVNGHISETELAGEVALRRLSYQRAMEQGGPLTRGLLQAIPRSLRDWSRSQGYHVVVDVRLQRLTTGQLPRPGGWHCDGNAVPWTGGRTALQQLCANRQWLIACTLSTAGEGLSNTRFVTQRLTADVGPAATLQKLWRVVDEAIEQRKAVSGFYDNEDGQLLLYDNHSLHRATPARGEGLRYWIRVSSSASPPAPC